MNQRQPQTRGKLNHMQTGIRGNQEPEVKHNHMQNGTRGKSGIRGNHELEAKHNHMQTPEATKGNVVSLTQSKAI